MSLLCINDFNAEIEENKSSRLIVDFLYNFFVGVASRNPAANHLKHNRNVIHNSASKALEESNLTQSSAATDALIEK